MRLLVVILNYRTPGLVIDCLYSLENQIQSGCDRVIVVDNASGDGSVTKIEQAIADNNWLPWVEVLASPINGGFSAGNNLGMQAHSAAAYLLLNSDTIVRPRAISKLLRAMEENPQAGIISPRLEWPDETPQISCFRDRSPWSELINGAQTGPITKLLERYDVPLPVSETPVEAEWTSFACVLIRREVVEKVGWMDEGYFMYFDDIDYCRRARKSGWRILYWPEARVVHLRGGSSSVKTEVATRKRPRSYLYASRSRYFAKFYGWFGLTIANLFWLTGRLISLSRELIAHKEPHTCEYEIQDIWTNWLHPMKPPTLT